MTRVFFLNRLRPGVSAQDYERWVREVDYPGAGSIPSILSYEVIRMEGPLGDMPVPFDYLEIVTVTDLTEYREDLETMSGDFLDELKSFIEPAPSSYSTPVT